MIVSENTGCIQPIPVSGCQFSTDVYTRDIVMNYSGLLHQYQITKMKPLFDAKPH